MQNERDDDVRTSEDRSTRDAVCLCNATAARKASRRLTQLYDEVLAPCGLRSTQLSILWELQVRADNPPTMVDLARALVTDRSALGHNLRPLQRAGLVAFQAGARDRRRRHVVLTAHGRAKVQDAARLWQHAQRRFNEVFGETEAERLRATLLAIAHDARLDSRVEAPKEPVTQTD